MNEQIELERDTDTVIDLGMTEIDLARPLAAVQERPEKKQAQTAVRIIVVVFWIVAVVILWMLFRME